MVKLQTDNEDTFFMDQVWDDVLKVRASVKDLQKDLQTREHARLSKLDERMKISKMSSFVLKIQPFKQPQIRSVKVQAC